MQHRVLKCQLMAVTWTCDVHQVIFWVAENNCTSMDGAIKIAKQFDPKVTTILTMAGVEADIMYMLKDGKWTAYDPVKVDLSSMHRLH
jgi:hypothetical protein